MNFGDTYKKLSTAKLLEILANKQDYKAEAIVAAELELASRTDVEQANEEFKEKNEALQKQKEIKEQKIRERKARMLDQITPQSEKRASRIINAISIVLLLFCIYCIFMSADFLFTTLSEPEDMDLYRIWFLAEVLSLPISLYFFWKRKKQGWILLMLWLVYRCGLIVYQMIRFASFLSSDGFFSNNYMPVPILGIFALYVIIYGVLIYFICRPAVRAVYFGGKGEEKLDVLDNALDSEQL